MFASQKSFWRVMANILPAATVNFLLGGGLAWVASALLYFESDECPFRPDDSEISWIASTYFAFEVSSPIILSKFSARIGRKPVMIVAAFFVTVSYVIIPFAKSANVIILSRAILGGSAGFHDFTWSIYVGEIAGPKERGIFGSIMSSAIIAGMTFVYMLSLFVSYFCLAVILTVIAAMAFVGSFFVVETPQISISYGKDTKALETLAWLRAGDVNDVKSEFEEIKHHLEEEKNNKRTFKHFLQHTSEYKVYIMCVVIFSFMQLTGHVVIVEFGAMIMNKYENVPSGTNFTFIYGTLQFIFVNLSLFLIETLGRRKLFIYGFGSSAIIQSIVAVLIYIDEYQIVVQSYIPQCIAVLILLYGIVFIICILPTAYVMKSELFPQELKAVGSVCATICNSLAQFVALKFFLSIWTGIGLYVNFAIYAVIALFSVTYIYILIPETKGQSLVQIQKNIAANNSRNRTADVP